MREKEVGTRGRCIEHMNFDAKVTFGLDMNELVNEKELIEGNSVNVV